MYKRFLLFAFIPVMLLSCNKNVLKKNIDPSVVNFRVTYDDDLDNVMYPSMMLALANYHGNDEPSFFSVSVTAPKNNSVMRIVVDSTNLNFVSITQESLPKKGMTYTFKPVIKWKYDNLYRLRQPGYVDFTFTCFVNDEEVDVKNVRLSYRPINECLLSLVSSDGTYNDYRWLFAAFVNEDHPKIDNILGEILGQGMVTTFEGMTSEKKVESQMRAIWYYALRRGMAYSSIASTSNGSRPANSQYIRFFDDVYNNRQANCIDACVYFSSIMRKIGLSPIIILEPSHAYLGYYTDKNKKKIALLETTLSGWVNLPELDRHFDADSNRLDETAFNSISQFLTEKQKTECLEGRMSLEDIKKAVSNNLFDKAAEYRKESFKKNKKLYDDENDSGYQMLVIDELRKQIAPIPAVD